MRALFNLLGFLAMAVAIIATTTSYSDEEDNRMTWSCEVSDTQERMGCTGRQDQIQQQLAIVSALVGIGMFVVANGVNRPSGTGPGRPDNHGGVPAMSGPQPPGPMPGPGTSPGPGAPPASPGWSQPRPPSR